MTEKYIVAEPTVENRDERLTEIKDSVRVYERKIGLLNH